MNKEEEFYFEVGGALHFDAPSYVERPADNRLREMIVAGELCYVLTTRQIGKSSLMVRTAAYLKKHGIHTALIDLTSIGSKASIDAWYLSLLDELQDQLPIATNAQEWWRENNSQTQVRRFTKFVQEVIPEEVDGRVVIFIDEIDSMLNLDFADDFFAAIRAIYNRDTSLSISRRISFVLLGVAAPNDLIKDQTRTPFNIGKRIKLEELALEEAQVLLRGLPGESRPILERIFFWTNGHPYLTQKIGLAIADEGEREWTESAIDDLVEVLFLTDEAFDEESNLRFVRARVISSPNKKQLLALYRKVYDGYKIRGNEQSVFQNELKLYGLLRTDDQNYLTIRNRIYRRVFNQEWIKEHTPVNWWRRLVVVAVLFSVTALIAGAFYWQRAPQPDDVLAQSYIADFEETTNPTLRLNNLANLFALEGYDQEAFALFNMLTPDERLALFEDLTPDLALQVRLVVTGIYQMLYLDAPISPNSSKTPEPCDHCDIIDLEVQRVSVMGSSELRRIETTRLLEAMLVALEQSTDAESRALRDEIDTWLKGRNYASEGNYDAAITAYDIVIGFNDENPATRFERALISALLNDYGAAVTDLTVVWETWPDRRDLILQEVNSDSGLTEYLLHMEEPPPFIEFVSTPTPVPTPTPMPTVTSPPEDTRTPTDVPSPTRASDSPTPTVSPTPVQNMEIVVLGHSVEEKPIEAVRFGNGDNGIVFIGGLQGAYSPGTVDLAQQAVSYFSKNLEAIPGTVTLYIVLNASPDASQDPGNLPGRLNANGVDLNRNWDCKWNKDPSIANEIVEGGGGPRAFSEPETQALRDFFLDLRPRAVVFWMARADSGVVISGGCRLDPLISDMLGEVYSEASRYRFISEEDAIFVPGDATNWLTEQRIPAVAVVLPEYERSDWTNNLNGILAVLESYK